MRLDGYDGNLLVSTSPELLLWPATFVISAATSLVPSAHMRVVMIVATVTVILFMYFFFRSPPIDKAGYDGLKPADMVSPADGVIGAIDIVPADEVEAMYGANGPPTEMLRIVILLDIFDKHFQAAPCEAIITGVQYKPGTFQPVGFISKSQYNERAVVQMKTSVREGRSPVTFNVVLIAGILTRRIMPFSNCQPQSRVDRGDKISLIKFGSRVDLVLPLDYAPSVMVGDKVKVGETLVAELR